jgi:hypothetical protein
VEPQMTNDRFIYAFTAAMVALSFALMLWWP